MAQHSTGLRGLLRIPALYQTAQDLLGARQFQRRFVDDWLGLAPGMRVLDIGCGPAAILDHVPPGVEYHGFDDNPDYIRAAQQRFGDRGTFWTAPVSLDAVPSDARFDRVIAVGVIHHLDDGLAATLLALARRALAPTGILVTYDPCFHQGQGRLARFLAAHDRGKHVRDHERYGELAGQQFSHCEAQILEGHLRIPYSATLLQCQA
jgi:cyclopropane fatty-acyl-phospholipid synthase-like methyltransferase